MRIRISSKYIKNIYQNKYTTAINEIRAYVRVLMIIAFWVTVVRLKDTLVEGLVFQNMRKLVFLEPKLIDDYCNVHATEKSPYPAPTCNPDGLSNVIVVDPSP